MTKTYCDMCNNGECETTRYRNMQLELIGDEMHTFDVCKGCLGLMRDWINGDANAPVSVDAVDPTPSHARVGPE